MTGTSMDGIDISLVKTNGIELERFNENYYYEYSKKSKKFLTEILDKDLKFNLNRKKKIRSIYYKRTLSSTKRSKNYKNLRFSWFSWTNNISQSRG